MRVMLLHLDSYMLGYGLTSGLLRAYNFDDSPSIILGAFVVDLEFVYWRFIPEHTQFGARLCM